MKEHTIFKEILFRREVSTQSEEDITPLLILMKNNNIPYSKIRFLKSCLEPCEDRKHGLSAHMCCNSSMLIRCLRILDKGTDCFTKKRQNGKIREKRGA